VRKTGTLEREVHMRKIVIGVAAVTMLVSTSVFAADMAVKAPPAAVWDWAGFYIGAGDSSTKRFRAYPVSKI
jgi:hypothetical protein